MLYTTFAPGPAHDPRADPHFEDCWTNGVTVEMNLLSGQADRCCCLNIKDRTVKKKTTGQREFSSTQRAPLYMGSLLYVTTVGCQRKYETCFEPDTKYSLSTCGTHSTLFRALLPLTVCLSPATLPAQTLANI
jgi:hypothetical protein